MTKKSKDKDDQKDTLDQNNTVSIKTRRKLEPPIDQIEDDNEEQQDINITTNNKKKIKTNERILKPPTPIKKLNKIVESSSSKKIKKKDINNNNSEEEEEEEEINIDDNENNDNNDDNSTKMSLDKPENIFTKDFYKQKLLVLNPENTETDEILNVFNNSIESEVYFEEEIKKNKKELVDNSSSRNRKLNNKKNKNNNNEISNKLLDSSDGSKSIHNNNNGLKDEKRYTERFEYLKSHENLLNRANYKEIDQSLDEFDELLAPFNKPNSYIIYQEKSAEDLDQEVEYDMDSEDEKWLNEYNRQSAQLAVGSNSSNQFSPDDFEQIIDRLEKETFAYKQEVGSDMFPHFSSEEAEDVCAVCFDGTSDDTNQIVYCDGCDIAVHQECYSIMLIPEGHWFCQKCSSPEKDQITCKICCKKKGAFKQTVDGDWVHLVCIMNIPEIQSILFRKYSGPREKLTPPDLLYKINKQRYKLQCQICKEKVGCCVQCRERKCSIAFHPYCIKVNQKNRLNQQNEFSPHSNLIFCNKHFNNYKSLSLINSNNNINKNNNNNNNNIDENQNNNNNNSKNNHLNGKDDYIKENNSSNEDEIIEITDENSITSIVENDDQSSTLLTEEEYQNNNQNNKKTVNKKPKICASKPPAVTQLLSEITSPTIQPTIPITNDHNNNNNTENELKVTTGITAKKAGLISFKRACQLIKYPHKFLNGVYNYWVKKRISRSGLPIIKRFQPSIIYSLRSTLQSQEMGINTRDSYDQMIMIRKDLEKARTILELIRKREKAKRNLVTNLRTFIDALLIKDHYLETQIIDVLSEIECFYPFCLPVTEDQAPNYFKFVKEPMSFQAISKKLNIYSYENIDEFWSDLRLISANAKLYNNTKTNIYKSSITMENLVSHLENNLPSSLTQLQLSNFILNFVNQKNLGTSFTQQLVLPLRSKSSPVKSSKSSPIKPSPNQSSTTITKSSLKKKSKSKTKKNVSFSSKNTIFNIESIKEFLAKQNEEPSPRAARALILAKKQLKQQQKDQKKSTSMDVDDDEEEDSDDNDDNDSSTTTTTTTTATNVDDNSQKLPRRYFATRSTPNIIKTIPPSTGRALRGITKRPFETNNESESESEPELEPEIESPKPKALSKRFRKQKKSSFQPITNQNDEQEQEEDDDDENQNKNNNDNEMIDVLELNCNDEMNVDTDTHTNNNNNKPTKKRRSSFSQLMDQQCFPALREHIEESLNVISSPSARDITSRARLFSTRHSLTIYDQLKYYLEELLEVDESGHLQQINRNKNNKNNNNNTAVSFESISNRVEKSQYLDIDSFWRDINTIIINLPKKYSKAIITKVDELKNKN